MTGKRDTDAPTTRCPATTTATTTTVAAEPTPGAGADPC